jgi:hypothetical protein
MPSNRFQWWSSWSLRSQNPSWGGIGCLVATTTTGGVLTYLMGGIGRVVASLQGPLPAPRVLEGAAAAAFVFSSVCYIGAALAPVAMMAYTSVADRIPDNFSLFGAAGTPAGTEVSSVPSAPTSP